MEDFMAQNSKKYRKKELQISQIEKTYDRLTGRAGLALFMEYLHAIEIFAWLQRFFGTIRKNRKGLCIFELSNSSFALWSMEPADDSAISTNSKKMPAMPVLLKHIRNKWPRLI
jgi:hypothetical protein